MKLKYYLRGLGIGIICTAIIMGIALSGNKKETLTDAEIIERARLLGMVMEDEDDSLEEEKVESSGEEAPDDASAAKPGEQQSDGQENTDSEDIQDAKEKADQEKAENDANAQADKPQEGDKNNSDEEKNDNSGRTEAPADSASNQENAEGTVRIEIEKGDFSDEVSKKLFQAGLIPDAGEFNQHLMNIGADMHLRTGVYQIPANATADEIINILQEKR